MNKVYVVTRGDYSDYSIQAIFTKREAAEKYYAVHPDVYGNEPVIEEWDISDGSEIECEKVYRAIFFIASEDGSLHSAEMKYSIKPFILDICKDRRKDDWCIHGISGYIPVHKTIKEQSVMAKIVFDHIAKWKAEQAGI